MDPYAILGITADATQEEVKQAYRREAMKWHPDRCDNSSEAKERFHRAAEAYRSISENHARAGSGGFATGARADRRDDQSNSGQSDYHAGPQSADHGSEDRFADSVFWDVMLDYAIKLAQTGLGEREISIDICRNGCPERLAAVIADKAFNIHAHYASNSGKRRKPGPDKSTFKQERLEAELIRAFLGPRHLFWSPRDTIEYYLVVFSEFRQAAKANPFAWISTNRGLMRILNFSLILFAIIVVAIDLYPGPSEYKLLPDTGLLQLPFAVLPLMFAWTLFRKLWVFTLALGLVYLATIAYFNSFMPQALASDLSSVLQVAVVCFAPFIFIALAANYFYYRKARAMIRMANRLFEEQLDKIVWIKNRATSSSTAAFMFVFVFYSSLVYLAPWNEDFTTSFRFVLPGIDIEKDDAATEKIRRQLKVASQFFEIAEAHFNQSPPDLIKAEIAYNTAADNGSLLAAYKLGYLYYVGAGGSRSDVLALAYFEQAIKAPLAFQPHSLQLTTKFLAESYNNLGIMYQSGFGTKRNLKKAYEMYSRGAEFGSSKAKLNLKTVYDSGAGAERGRLAEPIYE